jgi:iron complex transport system ATP-binding protein
VGRVLDWTRRTSQPAPARTLSGPPTCFLVSIGALGHIMSVDSDSGDSDSGSIPLRLRGVGVVRDGVAILDGIDWEIGPGERWAVLGPNGSGKTTLLRVAGMRLLPTRGTVEVLGATYGRSDARAVRRRVAFVSQSILRGLRPTLSTLDVVLTGRDAALETWWHRYDETDQRRAQDLLAAAGLGEAAERPFGVLSEGERQQVLLARALMAEPELLLLDEPAAGLDLGARERLVMHLTALAADPRTPPLVLVTHHVEELPAAITHVARPWWSSGGGWPHR